MSPSPISRMLPQAELSAPTPRRSPAPCNLRLSAPRTCGKGDFGKGRATARLAGAAATPPQAYVWRAVIGVDRSAGGLTCAPHTPLYAVGDAPPRSPRAADLVTQRIHQRLVMLALRLVVAGF